MFLADHIINDTVRIGPCLVGTLTLLTPSSSGSIRYQSPWLGALKDKITHTTTTAAALRPGHGKVSLPLSMSSLLHYIEFITPHRPINLATIPTDVVELIAYHAVVADTLGPPQILISLLSTCRSLHYSLSANNNHSLYADIFRYKFDTAAPLRRFSRTQPWRISSAALTAELRGRFTTLRHMRQTVLAGGFTANWGGVSSTTDDLLRHLWTIYFMCIESDGRNADQLLNYGHLRAYIRICIERSLFPTLHLDAYLPETLDRALILWILWLSTSWSTL